MKKRRFLVAALALAGFGCDSSSGGEGGTGGTSQSVTIDFAAMVADQVFVCGTTYDNLGADDSSLELSDFRFYVQGLELKNADGDYVAIDLDTDGNIWQVDNVALLDFEEGCTNFGDEATNRVVTGTVPEGSYDGLRFKMGVPFELNHANPAIAEPPLNLTPMHWDWQGGYKFLRIDTGDSSQTTWRMHLGSTGCDGDQLAGGTTTCTAPNRVDVELDAFDPESDTVVADFAQLVEGAALDVHQDGTVGCMALPSDSDCAPLFENLGLPFDGSVPGTQQFFSVE